MARQITPEIRAELEQTPQWWDRQYEALVKKHVPRDAASHTGHEIEEPIQFYSGGYAAKPYCLDCRVTLDRSPDG